MVDVYKRQEVESSKFITKKKSETLIEKIHTMTSPGQVAKLSLIHI